jgi:hypothetical protein
MSIKTGVIERVSESDLVMTLQREPAPLISEQDARSWQRGFDDGMAGKPGRCPVACDKPSYRSGWVEGNAARESGCTRGNW